MHSHEISDPQKQAIYKCSLTSITQQSTSARSRIAFIQILWLPRTGIWGYLWLSTNSCPDLPDQLQITSNTNQMNMGFPVWGPEAWAIWGEVPETVDRTHPSVTQLPLLPTPGWQNERSALMKTSCYKAGKAWKRFSNYSCKQMSCDFRLSAVQPEEEAGIVLLQV